MDTELDIYQLIEMGVPSAIAVYLVYFITHKIDRSLRDVRDSILDLTHHIKQQSAGRFL